MLFEADHDDVAEEAMDTYEAVDANDILKRFPGCVIIDKLERGITNEASFNRHLGQLYVPEHLPFIIVKEDIKFFNKQRVWMSFIIRIIVHRTDPKKIGTDQ